jgi:hypothetical protein
VSGIGTPDSMAGVIELALAQRDGMAESLAKMVNLLERVGGFMPSKDQADLREAIARLIEAGWRVQR